MVAVLLPSMMEACSGGRGARRSIYCLALLLCCRVWDFEHERYVNHTREKYLSCKIDCPSMSEKPKRNECRRRIK